jgi:hypothetical protein
MNGLWRIIGLALLGGLALGLRVWAVLSISTDPSQGAAVVPWLQCLAGTAMVFAVAWLGWSLLGQQSGIGWMAALAAAVDPGLVVAVIHPCAALWAALGLACLMAVVVSPRWRATRGGAILVGCLCGAILLIEPVLLLALPICAVAFWLHEGERSWSDRFRPAAAGRLAILVGLAAVIAGAWLAGSRLVRDPAIAESRIEANRQEPRNGYTRDCVQRLRGLLLESPAQASCPPGVPQGLLGRLGRFAAVAWLVLAVMGCWVSHDAWRVFWPSYAVFAAVLLSHALGIIPCSSRIAIEPIGLVWAALAIGLPLGRLFVKPPFRVYRPGERGDDPLGREQILRGPHYDVHVRRRAG